MFCYKFSPDIQLMCSFAHFPLLLICKSLSDHPKHFLPFGVYTLSCTCNLFSHLWPYTSVVIFQSSCSAYLFLLILTGHQSNPLALSFLLFKVSFNCINTILYLSSYPSAPIQGFCGPKHGRQAAFGFRAHLELFYNGGRMRYLNSLASFAVSSESLGKKMVMCKNISSYCICPRRF